MFALATRLVGLRIYFPSNIAIALLRTRRGLKWGVPAMLLAPVHGALAYWLHAQAEATGAGWLSLLAVICAISAIKFAAFGPLSLVLLAVARLREAHERRVAARAAREDAAALVAA